MRRDLECRGLSGRCIYCFQQRLPLSSKINPSATAMKSVLTFTLLMFLVGTSGAIQSAESVPSMLQITKRMPSQGEPLITTLGMYAVNAGTAAHIDLAQYSDPQNGEAWATEFGTGYLLPLRVDVYVGGGIVVGYRRKDGEYFAAWYPEVGAVVPITDGFGLSVSSKRYQNLFQKIENVVTFGVVLTLK